MSRTQAVVVDEAGAVQPALFRVHQVAEILSMSSTMVRNLTREGVLPCRRIGRMVRYAPEDITCFIDSYRDHPYR